VDQEGEGMTTPRTSDLTEEEQNTVGLGAPPVLADTADTVLSARGLLKTFGKVVGVDGVDVDLFPGEVLSVIGDNGAGKSTLIKALTGALIPDAGNVYLDGNEVHFRTPQDARGAGIETVYQTLAVAPALDIAENMYLGRERRRAGQPRHRHRAEHEPGGGDPLRWSAAGSRGRTGGYVRHQVRRLG
jgi:ABC-type glutathione transport system ATPase component